ncbi:MAG TPA: Stp1/IreP family PP2C-type Ser/Thr phosphatase [Polyangiaceae bacterium]|nr:Stp1/IreP family PP2C-type Ser/Thr phosphatase [Polyangiaceae bacterium]
MTENGAGSGLKVRVFGRTDVGQIREHNEDNFLVADLTRRTRSLMESDREPPIGERGMLLGVCDGMGGAAAGEVASQLAVDIIYEKLLQGDPPANHDDLARRLVQAVEEAGVRIFNEARADRTRRGMGTTATIAALMDARLFVAQVGDSRAYVLRGDRFTQVSRDQSLVNQLIEAGQLTEEEAETFEHNNIILQALGTAETVQVDLTYVDLCRGDRLLVCSDGLSGMVRGDEMREVLLSTRDSLEACKELTERANRAGGHDNITVIVAEFDGPGLAPPAPDALISYQKYALPEAPVDTTVRAPAVTQRPQEDDSPPTASDEATRESRRLRVGHTMVGAVNPIAGLSSTPPGARVSGAPPSFSMENEPVSIPTSGLPPSVVGIMVLGAMLFVAMLGYLLVR